MEAWPELETKVLAEFEQLLRKEAIPDAVLLKIFVINIFMFNNFNNVPDGITPSYIGMAQRTDVQKYSVSLALEMYFAAMRVAVKISAVPKPNSLPKNLMSMSIFSDWIKYNVLYLKKSEFSQVIITNIILFKFYCKVILLIHFVLIYYFNIWCSKYIFLG